jgi:hypothetical protein
MYGVVNPMGGNTASAAAAATGPRGLFGLNPSQANAVTQGIGSLGSALSQGFQNAAQASMQGAKNIANIKSAIPSPQDFENQQKNLVALSAPVYT